MNSKIAIIAVAAVAVAGVAIFLSVGASNVSNNGLQQKTPAQTTAQEQAPAQPSQPPASSPTPEQQQLPPQQQQPQPTQPVVDKPKEYSTLENLAPLGFTEQSLQDEDSRRAISSDWINKCYQTLPSGNASCDDAMYRLWTDCNHWQNSGEWCHNQRMITYLYRTGAITIQEANR